MVSRKKLVEILVCVGIVLIIGAIILPVFGQSKGKQWNRCLRNMKQLGQSSLLYRTDFDDHLPLADRWEKGLALYQLGHSLSCDATPEKEHGYAMMESLSGVGGKTILKPDEQLLFIESVALVPNAAGDQRLMPDPGRHRGLNYVTYADGHAKVWKPSR
ncbi:MAG: hypothetical protein ACO1SV_22325 [Fimbriimonas sp.]